IDGKNKNDAQMYRRTNTQGTERLAKVASERGVRQFLYLSSIKVNGEKNAVGVNNEPYAFNEDDSPCPQDAYAISKLEAENAIRKICHESDMAFVILRPALVYGPGVRANFLYLLNIVNQNYPLPLVTVKNSRSLLYVKNLAHAISACINCPEIANQTYLISDADISVPELIRKIASMLGKRTLLFPFPVGLLKLIGSLLGKRSMIDRLTDSLLVNNSRLIQDLQWTPPYSLDEGLHATIDWYKHR
ncbi:MAG: NAD-dependent epimerase/dehydratase family protein, partial [Bacteroidetes bacterium]|nr:NAD-dependent epimerase/dehydratase family protein [Bacteroidota bacterium]